MKEFFTTTIGAWDDGSVRLTAPGIAVVVVIIALLVVQRKKQFSPQNSLSTLPLRLRLQ